MKKNIQNPLSRVKFPAEHVPGAKKCKAIDGDRGKPVTRNFFSKICKKQLLSNFLATCNFFNFFQQRDHVQLTILRRK